MSDKSHTTSNPDGTLSNKIRVSSYTRPADFYCYGILTHSYHQCPNSYHTLPHKIPQDFCSYRLVSHPYHTLSKPYHDNSYTKPDFKLKNEKMVLDENSMVVDMIVDGMDPVFDGSALSINRSDKAILGMAKKVVVLDQF